MCVCVCVCVSFPFGFEPGMWDLIVLIPDQCLALYFQLSWLPIKINDFAKIIKHGRGLP